jgi:MGT family glycosyltransferase
MARILLTVPPLVGHLNPALAVAAELEKQGHVLAWAVHVAQVGERLPAGAQVYPLDVADGFDFNAASPQVRGLESVRLFFEDFAMPLACASLAPLEAAARAFRPDVMVVDHQMPAGALVARKLGLPWVSLVTTTASILKMSAILDMKSSATLDSWVQEQFLELQTGYLDPRDIVPRPEFSPWDVIVFSVESLIGRNYERVPANYSFVGPTHGSGRREVEFPWQWLDHSRPRLLVSLGTVSRDRDTRFFEVIMEAVADMNVQVVMVAPESLAGQAPANVLVQPYIPQLDVLDYVNGVICHAGHNTVCEALVRGLPLIVAPIRDDQPVIARQVIDAGAGLFLRHGKATPSMAKKAITELLENPLLRESAQRLAPELQAARGEAGAAAIISALAARDTLLDKVS